MKDIDLYSKILGIQSPWQVYNVELDLPAEKVSVFVEQEPGSALTCPKCGATCPGYDKRRRQWRHLDTYKTLLIADLPQVECPEHGVVTVHVPWGEPGFRNKERFRTAIYFHLGGLDLYPETVKK